MNELSRCPLCDIEWALHPKAPYPYDGYLCDKFDADEDVLDSLVNWVNTNRTLDED